MHEAVLVLNANFEPIHICTMCRAIGLILSGKANLVMNGRGEIRTVSRIYPKPSIIRLARMVKRPRPQVRLTKREVLRRDNYTCQYCGKRSIHLTVDHVFPRRLGGRQTWTNLVAACPSCNHRKGGRTLEQAGMYLRCLPEEPPTSMQYFFARHVAANNDWLPFLEGW
jgi:5-methylcytosine-specific restriction endonuclease McrA